MEGGRGQYDASIKRASIASKDSHDPLANIKLPSTRYPPAPNFDELVSTVSLSRSMPLVSNVVDDKSPLILYDATWFPGTAQDDLYATEYVP